MYVLSVSGLECMQTGQLLLATNNGFWFFDPNRACVYTKPIVHIPPRIDSEINAIVLTAGDRLCCSTGMVFTVITMPYEYDHPLRRPKF